MDDLNTRIQRALGHEVRYAANGVTLEYRITSNPPGFEAWLQVPDWAHDLNLALQLVEDVRCVIVRRPHVQNWSVSIGWNEDAFIYPSLSEAICEAWLQYDAARKERG